MRQISARLISFPPSHSTKLETIWQWVTTAVESLSSSISTLRIQDILITGILRRYRVMSRSLIISNPSNQTKKSILSSSSTTTRIPSRCSLQMTESSSYGNLTIRSIERWAKLVLDRMGRQSCRRVRFWMRGMKVWRGCSISSATTTTSTPCPAPPTLKTSSPQTTCVSTYGTLKTTIWLLTQQI